MWLLSDTVPPMYMHKKIMDLSCFLCLSNAGFSLSTPREARDPSPEGGECRVPDRGGNYVADGMYVCMYGRTTTAYACVL